MNTRNERRRQAKQEARERREGEVHSQRIRKIAVGGAGLLAVAAVAGVWGYQSTRAPDSRVPASTPAGAASPSGRPGMTLEEAQAQIKKKTEFQHKAKEWVWAEEGHTELVIEAYGKVKGSGISGHEERSRLIKALGLNVKPRSKWPKDFNEAKARNVVDFLAKVLTGESAPGAEPVTAIHALTAYGTEVPELRSHAEEAILKYYAADERIGTRGACLDALSQLHSAKAVPFLKKAVLSSESGTSRSAAYSLANYLGSPEEREPREALIKVAGLNPELRPLVVKLLAFHGVKGAGAFVPKLLTAHSNAAEIEAGAYTIEQLKLKQYGGLLRKYGKADSPFLQQQIDSALKITGP